MRCLLRSLAGGLGTVRAGAILLDSKRERSIYNEIFVAPGNELVTPEHYGTIAHIEQLKRTSGKWIVAVDDTSVTNPLDTYRDYSFVPTGIHAALQAPIIANGELIGFLTVSCTRGPIAWTAEQRLYALSLSNLAALVVERHQRLQLEAEARRRAERLARQQRLLNDLMCSTAIRTGNLDSVFGDITVALCKEMSVDRVSVRLFGDSGEEHILTEIYVAREDRVIAVPRNGKRRYPEVLAGMLHEGPIAVEDCAIDPRTRGFYATDLEPRRIRAMLHVPVLNGGEIVGVVQCSTYDTPREWLPEDHLLAAGVANLIALVSERRLRLDVEETLRKANLEAEEANKAKSQFLANMSHEIRTPMNGVLGMTDLLIRSGLTERQMRLAGTISESARALLTIINDILDLSRIEGGKLVLDPHEFELGQCVEDAAELLAEQAHKKGLDLNLFVDDAVMGTVTADPVRLRQVLVNLIANAIKFTAKGEVSVHVGPAEGKADERDATGVRFLVRDTGIGIDPRVQSKLFQPFSQADTSITRRFGGTGLGLSISRYLVEMMGGSMGMSSVEGEGTTIWFTLPLEVRRSGAGERRRLTGMGGRRVIVIDDNATNREIISSYLASCGAVIETADGAESGLDRIEAAKWCGAPFELAIIDYKMVGCDGLELARRIRANMALAGTQLMLLSSMSWEGDAAQARAAGFSMLLHKPIRRHELVSKVAECLSSSSGTSEAEAAIDRATVEVAPSLGLRVLVAEDNPVNQVVAEEYLNNLGCQIVIVENGARAVEASTQQVFDVVLMDCQMPEMDGYAATQAIRARERECGLPALPIVAVTANAFDSDRQRCLEAGMNGYLSKPYSEAELAAALARWKLTKVEAEIVLAETATTFPYLASELTAALVAAVADGNAGALADAAGRLRIAGETAGAHEIAESARRAAMQAKDGDIAGAAEAVMRLTVIVAGQTGESREIGARLSA
jgi:signal transduction histidine kinase/CheY-like chemotaxis protein